MALRRAPVASPSASGTAAVGAVAAVGDLQGQRVLLVSEGDPAAVRGRMLDHVGDRLLDHPVRRQVQPGGKRRALASDVQVHPDAGLGGPGDQAAQVPQAGGGHQPGSPRAGRPSPVARRAGSCGGRIGPEHAEQRPHLAQRAAADLLDRRQRAGRLLGLRGDHIVGDTGLHRDQAHRVRHHVVQLASDLQPFLAAGAAGFGHLLVRPPFRLRLTAREVGTLLPHRVADHPRGGD